MLRGRNAMSSSNDIPEYAELKDLTDREILLVIIEKLRVISTNQTNHLHRHHVYFMAMLGITGAAVAEAIILLLSRF